MEDSLIKRKNLRSKKGKKNWARNLDTSALETQIEEKNTTEH